MIGKRKVKWYERGESNLKLRQNSFVFEEVGAEGEEEEEEEEGALRGTGTIEAASASLRYS